MRQAMRHFAALLLVLAVCGTVSGRAGAEQRDAVYLTVASIDFTLVGETENIYCGTLPAEEVEWSSEDPAIVSVKDGVLTAEGVGRTVIHAEYQDQHWVCTAGCLAEDEAARDALPLSVLQTPKRMPPETDFDPAEYFSDAALIGDSISYIFYQNEMRSNQMGHPLFLARGGCSINGFLIHSKNMLYRGQEMHLEDAIRESGVKKIFIMLGQNDLGFASVEDTLKNYATLLEVIREANPGIAIYLQTCAQEYAELNPFNTRNINIYEFNKRLPQFAEEQGCKLVDIAPYLESHTKRLAPCYSLDKEIHVNFEGCIVWGQALSNFAELEQIRGD